MSEIDPLAPDAVTIRAVQFVGTNVEMTYLVDAGHDAGHDAEARLEEAEEKGYDAKDWWFTLRDR